MPLWEGIARARDGLTESRHQPGLVYIVDDDPAVHEYMRCVLRPTGWRVEVYDDLRTFLDNFVRCTPACLIADTRMRELGGLDLQASLASMKAELPIIMMSERADVPSVVRAMRNGALDFLEKPVDAELLLDRVRTAMAASSAAHRAIAEQADLIAALGELTPRQRAVLEGLMEGKPSKAIAADLGISLRTVDVHRFRLMHAIGAESLPDLFRRVVLVLGRSPRQGALPPRTPAPTRRRHPGFGWSVSGSTPWPRTQPRRDRCPVPSPVTR